MKTLLSSAACLCLLASPVLAQDRLVPPPRPPQAPAERNVARSPVTQDQPDSDYASLPVLDLLASYAKLTGTKVIPDATVQGTVTFPKLQDLNDEQKAEVIEKALFLHGFALYDAGDHLVAVLGLGKLARSEGLPVYSKPEELPTRERVITYVFKLEHRDSLRLASLLQQYVPPANIAAFTPVANSHMLLVTGRTSMIRHWLKLIPMLDVPEEPSPEKPPQTTR